jgi:hypothetical protein
MSIAEDVKNKLEAAGIDVVGIEVKSYPDETFVIVLVPKPAAAEAIHIANAMDDEFASAEMPVYVTVRSSVQRPSATAQMAAVKDGVNDQRVDDLISLLGSRSKTSENQPSLQYFRDAVQNIALAGAAQHSLIFGRRGAGKTALMLEARRSMEERGDSAIWFNMQTYRQESTERIFLYALGDLLAFVASFRTRPRFAVLTESVDAADRLVRDMLEAPEEPSRTSVTRLIPRVNRILRRFDAAFGNALFMFIDDFYFLNKSEQPLFLDYLYSVTRDCDIWLKIASIRNLTRWFQADPPLGLQTYHDASQINLDVTLQDPGRAQEFLEQVLASYARAAGIGFISSIFSGAARDRMVVASGAVPRDYLLLAAESIRQARRRDKARLVGVQDVNRAAGEAADSKLRELEDDVAANPSLDDITLDVLRIVSDFALEEERWTVFRVDFKDKESLPRQYAALSQLVDVRLVHLIDPSVSDGRKAGVKYETYMLDYSQYTGHRLKKDLTVLDFENGQVVLRTTGQGGGKRTANSSRGRIGLLRLTPLLNLERLPQV